MKKKEIMRKGKEKRKKTGRKMFRKETMRKRSKKTKESERNRKKYGKWKLKKI